jgi:hypothetical protein
VGSKDHAGGKQDTGLGTKVYGTSDQVSFFSAMFK